MPLNQRVQPNTKLNNPVASNGRSFNPANGTVDLSSVDMAVSVLGANGWLVLPQHGTTAQRPTTTAPGGNAVPFYDDTLAETIFPIIWPVGSGEIVAWVDGAGNTV